MRSRSVSETHVAVCHVAWESEEVPRRQVDRFTERTGAQPPGDHEQVMKGAGWVRINRCGLGAAALQSQ